MKKTEIHNKVIKSYKGFNKDMTCRDFPYEEGKEYETETANVCKSGFHACEMPLEVFKHYPPDRSVYHEVEQGGDISKADDGSTKIASTKIKIGASITIKKLIKAQIDFTFEKIKNATSGDESIAAASGYRSTAATSGYRSTAATSGDESTAAASGDESTAAASGDESIAATSGYRSIAATSGDESIAAASGDGSTVAASGYRSIAATSGYGSTAAASGYGSIAVAWGKKGRAKSIIGSYIVLTEWDDKSGELIEAKMAYVDGQKIKSDTWYELKNGKFVEIETE